MPKIAGPPLRKITLNLFETDVTWFQERYGQGYSEFIRDVVNNHVMKERLSLAIRYRQGAEEDGQRD